jgi:hypothetical protein
MNSQINDKMRNVRPKRTNFTSVCIGTVFIFYKAKCGNNVAEFQCLGYYTFAWAVENDANCNSKII